MHTMPFGRFKHRPINTLPDDYLDWLANLPDLREPLLSEVMREVERRAYQQEHSASPSSCPSPELASEIVTAGFKTLAKKLHPDAGGNHEQMLALNNAVEWLRSRVRGLSA
jgi:Putative quorum-sensing-regulated virulence factor